MLSDGETSALIADAEKHQELVVCGNAQHTNFEVGCPDCAVVCDYCTCPWPCDARKLADALSALTVPDGDVRERLARTAYSVLGDTMNYPKEVRPHLLGRSISPLAYAMVNAILNEFPELGRETAQRSVSDLAPGSEWIVKGHGARVTILEVTNPGDHPAGPFVSFRFADGKTSVCTEASFRDAHEPAPEPGIRARVLRILADHDHNDGGMMRWHPSGEPTEQAEKVADRIMREAFNAVEGVQ